MQVKPMAACRIVLKASLLYLALERCTQEIMFNLASACLDEVWADNLVFVWMARCNMSPTCLSMSIRHIEENYHIPAT
jgi:hypothetical protein